MDHKKLARVMDWSSLSKPRSVDGSDTYVAVSIRSSPDDIEEQRPVKGNIICVIGHTFSAFWLLIPAFIWSLIRELWGYWFLFAMHAVASPFMCIWGCITLNVKYFVAAASVIQHLIICLVMTICSPLTIYSRMFKKKRPLLEVSQETLFVISCITVLLDPMFFYIPIIDEEKKWLDMDNKLMIVVLVLRSLSDLFFICRIATRIQLIHDDIVDAGSKNRWLACKYICYYFCSFFCDRAEMRLRLLLKWIQSDSVLNLLPILPVQQVAIIITFFRLGSSGYSFKTGILNIFLVLQLISRAYHIYRSHRHCKIIWGKARGALNLFLYILAAHRVPCADTKWCVTTYYRNSNTSTSPSVAHLDGACPVRNENKTTIDFGIYLNALQSGITGHINFPSKLLYAFWWGFKNLSNFGTNLETSGYVWENFFTILIGVLGLLLFSLLIGNVQTYIMWQSQKEVLRKEEKVRATYKDIDSWMAIHLSSDKLLKKKITEYIRDNKKVEEQHYASNKDMDIDVDLKFFSIMLKESKAMFTRLKEHFCKHAIKKVLMRMDKNMDMDMDKYLSMISKHLKPKVYKENSPVFQTGKPLNTMLFIIDGVIVANNEGSSGGVESSESNCKKADLVGEDIFTEFKGPADAPLSTRNYKCETKVEALALSYKRWRRDIQPFLREPAVKVVYSKTELIILNKAYRKLTTTRRVEIEREIELRLKYDRNKDRESKENMICVKETDILDWLSRNGFSDKAKIKIMTHVRVNGIVRRTIDDDVDVKYLLSQPICDLPWDIHKSIRKQLGMKSLKKVPMLQKMDDSVLSIMCEEYLQPKIYSAETCLVGAGQPVDLMFIIIEGIVACTEDTIAGSSRCLEKCHFYGEPLLSWASPNNLFSGPAPVSLEDVICLTKVEVLELKASQFRSLVAAFNSQWISNFNMCSDFSQQLDENVVFPFDNIDDEQLKETYMQLESKEVARKVKSTMTTKESEILDWMSSVGLSRDIMTEIKQGLQISKVLGEDIDVQADVNLEYVLDKLPLNIKQSLKKHICISTLKKVPILENVDEDLLYCICTNLEPVIHRQDRYIINAGKPLDQMLIVVKGALVISTGSTCSESSLARGGVFGEEILTSAFPNIFFPPVSNQDVRCETDVEALVLTVEGLQRVLSHCRDKLYHSDEELAPIIPLGCGVVPYDNSLSSSSSTSVEKKLDYILQHQNNARDDMANMMAFLTKLGYKGTRPHRAMTEPGFDLSRNQAEKREKGNRRWKNRKRKTENLEEISFWRK